VVSFTAQILHDLRSIFASVYLDFESQLVEFDGEDDPVHLLVNPPKTTAGGSSARLIERGRGRLRRPRYPSPR